MTDAILFFTFSPIQSFISEARRAEDLFNGSAILVELARAAAERLGTGNLIYPAPPLTNDVPNVLVARLPLDQAKTRADEARKALHDRWMSIAAAAHHTMRLPEDAVWQEIWTRQTNPETLWQVYWAAVPIGEQGYAKAYDQARRAVDALKRSRLFLPSEEKGQKDSLSGNREALRTAQFIKSRDYWAQVANLPGILPSKIRPNGRERLDAIGAVKRFYEHTQRGRFLSTSSIASADFLEMAKAKAPNLLAQYSQTLLALLGDNLYRVRNDPKWPYDGDLFYLETLTRERLQEDYRLTSENANKLTTCQKALKALHTKCGPPSKYYAVIVLDGDSMGVTIDELLQKDAAEKAHQTFSKKLNAFSRKVPEIVRQSDGFLVYNGGDDVLCMAPLSKAIPLTQELAEVFRTTQPNNGWFKSIPLPETSASAGIAITHHQSPLDFALEEARRAEHAAKAVDGKAAVCLSLLKRSGEPLIARSKWEHLGNSLNELQTLFSGGKLSNRLAYAVQRESPVLAGLGPDARESALKVLLKRHAEEGFQDAEIWAKTLGEWAAQMDAYLPKSSENPCRDNTQPDLEPGLSEVGNWLVLARFLASGGGE